MAPLGAPAPRRLFAGGAALAGALLAWLATTPEALVHINWDAGSYLHGIASGRIDWHHPPWNAHFALHYLYLPATWIASALGGTPADGFRLLGAVCFAASSALVADATWFLSRSRPLAGVLTAVWATAFVTLFLIFTLEDNIVFLTASTCVLWLCAVYRHRWSWKAAALAGLLGACAALLSLQGVLYVAPPLYLTLFLRPPGLAWRRRGIEAAALLGACALGILAFVAFIAATSRLSTAQLLDILLSRPQPSQFPESRAEILALLTDWRGSLRTVGLALSFQLFQNRIVPATPEAILLGTAALVVELGLWLFTTVWLVRRKEIAPHLFAATLLLFTILTSLYRDVEYAYLKRTDFLPLLGVLLASAAIGPTFANARARPGLKWGLAGALALLVAQQSASALLWRTQEVASYATLDNTILQGRVPGYHGTADGSYLRHLRAIRQQHPEACAFVFDLDELAHGRWNPDITGLLWAELPSHVVLAALGTASTWPRPVRTLTPDEARGRFGGCEWLSEAAKRRLGQGGRQGKRTEVE